MDYDTPMACQHCGTFNDPRNNLGILACASCGLTSVEGAFSMQDDLSKLFDRGMTFSQPPPQAQPAQIETKPSGLGYSASQHYIPVTRPALRIEEITMPLELQSMLLRRHLDPATLLPAQRTLFENANPEQRERLLMLWSISSPAQTRATGLGQGETTSLEQEEALARMSFERRQQMQQEESPEPYIESGYGLNDPTLPAYRQSNDPVFESKEWWRHDTTHQKPQEYQYGMYEAMRQYHVPCIGDDEMTT